MRDERVSVVAQTDTPEMPFELSGGSLCLDCANTVYRRPTAHPQERLTSYADLVRWSRQAGIVTDLEARRLIQEATHQPTAAATVLERAMALRETIYRIFSAVAHKCLPQAEDLATLNAMLTQALPLLRIIPTAGGFTWDWTRREEVLDDMFWPVVRSAADLLTSQELEAVRECMARDCGWLFIDRSRNRKRQWCDMKVCGNREKVRRYHERRKAGSELPRTRPRIDS